MAKVLVIVESPAKAKTIGKFLGTRKYIVKSSMGHIRDLPKSKLGVDIEENFEPKYINIRGKGDLIKDIKKAAKKTEKILLATDPDREGEAIAWHLQKILDIDDNSVCRIEFNEITKNAIKDAVKHPRCINYNRVDAQQARRVLDRLVGYKLSPLLWKKIRKGLSAGRVQSVTVLIICERENEIKNFIPEEYWSIVALLKTNKKEKFEAKLYKFNNKNIEIKSEEETNKILDDLKEAEYTVKDIKKKEKKKNPPISFTTSSLQQDAYKKLGFTTRKTMMIAQQLYEGIEIGKKEGTIGLITYIRTDSTRISNIAKEEAKDYISEQFGNNYISNIERKKVLGKNAQDAHEAIRPTSVERKPELLSNVLSKDQFKLYKLIWERFVSSQMAVAIFDTTTIDINANGYTFRANGKIIKFDGFMKVYTESKDDKKDSSILPELTENEIINLNKLVEKQHFTQSPSRYSEATLVKILEELGIGRPSTYAPTIETIINRGYIVREKKQLVPTELGFIVIDLLKEFFSDIIDIDFTAKLENDLDKIENGELEWKRIVKYFYEPFEKELEHAEKEIGEIELVEEVSDVICEKCGRNMVIKMGRYGNFLACPGFPECRNTKPILDKIGIQCPLCSGTIVRRKSKKGRQFYGCDKYPECDFTSWDEPVNERCPKCNSILLKKENKKENKLYCSNEECEYTKNLEEENEPNQ